MWTLLLSGMLVAAAPEVEVRTLGAGPVVGTLARIGDEGLTVQTADGPRDVLMAELMSLSPKSPPAAGAEAGIRVELVDGSSPVGKGYTVSGGKARLDRPGGTLEIPTRDIKSVRLEPPSPAIAAQWERIVGAEIDGDRLVVRKDNALDYHRGTLADVTDTVVQFTLGGDTLSVKRSKVFALVYYHPAGRELPPAVATLTDATGSRWSVRSPRLDGGNLMATTPSGIAVSVPLETIVRVDFSRGKIVFLSDLDPDTSRWTPYLGTAEELPARAEFFGPRRDRGIDSRPLSLGGSEYRKGLALHSRTLLEYRLPGAFRRLQATVGIDDHARPEGNVRLVIRGDDRVLFEAALTGADPPRPIDMDLGGVRRLSILVDFGDNFDVGDYLDLCEARLVK